MNLQQENLKKELKKLWTGELASIFAFWCCFSVMKVWLTTSQMTVSILFPLCILSLILAQGSAYWMILLKRLSAPHFAIRYTGRIYHIFKNADIILLVLGLPVILLNYSSFSVAIVSFFLLGFAFIEWINYFKFRLAYSYNPLVLFKKIRNRQWKESKLAREIRNIMPT